MGVARKNIFFLHQQHKKRPSQKKLDVDAPPPPSLSLSPYMLSLPPELTRVVLGHIASVRDLFHLMSTCTTIYRALTSRAGHDASSWTVVDDLSRTLATNNLRHLVATVFHLDFTAFCSMLRTNCALLSGSAPLQALLNESYDLSDLDIFLEVDVLVWKDRHVFDPGVAGGGESERSRCASMLQCIVESMITGHVRLQETDQDGGVPYYLRSHSDILYVFTFAIDPGDGAAVSSPQRKNIQFIVTTQAPHVQVSMFDYTFLANTFDGVHWTIPQLSQVALKVGEYSDFAKREFAHMCQRYCHGLNAKRMRESIETFVDTAAKRRRKYNTRGFFIRGESLAPPWSV